MIEGSGSVPLTDGSGRPKYLRIRNIALDTAFFYHVFSYLNPSVAEAMEVETEQVNQHT